MNILVRIFLLGALASGTTDAQAETPGQAPPLAEPPVYDSCYGDRFETDADLNEASPISDEEIALLLNPPAS
ncbi:MAG: hypothetical protein HQ483_04705 [Rhodospirillales bacterium]|nr:hypothetical protein [Rhodospirillales bacterium]